MSTRIITATSAQRFWSLSYNAKRSQLIASLDCSLPQVANDHARQPNRLPAKRLPGVEALTALLTELAVSNHLAHQLRRFEPS
ncbi:MAG: hypothetical protein ACI91B_000281 [Planctomycetota bacterium]|jgi:hypothetical protein